MKLWSIAGNEQRLDGGAMFGNAPRALWTRWAAPDDLNRIRLACRALLVQDGGRLILFEAGIGAFFPPAMQDRFGVEGGGHRLLANLAAAGFSEDQIDVVVLSHLHFDHAGGLLSAWAEGRDHSLHFPNARFVVGEQAWARALDPHPRDRASFIPALNRLLQDSGRLQIARGGDAEDLLGPGYRFHLSHGHTPGLLLTEIPSEGGPIVFAGDLIPGVPWVRVPITMGYDRYPELLIDEKRALLEDLIGRGGRLFFTHDPEVSLARVARNEKGRFTAADPMGTLQGLAA